MSRFPKITETFILYEILAMEQQGLQIELYPLQREKTTVIHPEAKPLVERAHFHPFISRAILRAHIHFLKHKPNRYLSTLWTLLRANWGSFRFFFGALAFFPKTVYFAHLMAARGITHVHAHFASHPAAAGFTIYRLTGIPYSFTAHGSDLHRDQHMLYEKVAEAAFVVPISNYNKEMIVEVCNGKFSDKMVVVHCGVDTQVFQPVLESNSYKRGASPFTILCVGTLHEVKGQTYLIEACRLLRDKGIDFACHLVGDGPDMAALTMQVSQMSLADQVHFHGRLTRGEIATLLRQTDVVATPSVPTSNGRREGIPVVLMEAMASGVAVIASKLSGIPELVDEGQSGLLVQPRDVQGLANALELLYRNPDLRRQFGLAGRDKVVHDFDLNKNAVVLGRHFGFEIES